MVLVKILKRKDASSVVVAILIAMIIAQPLSMLTSPWPSKILGLKEGESMSFGPPNMGWKWYASTALWALLQLIVLELLAWIYVLVASAFKKRK